MRLVGLLASGGQIARWIRVHSGALGLAVATPLCVAFSVFLVYNEDPWVFGRFIVIGIAYLAAVILSLVWLAGSRARRSSLILLLLGTILVIGGVYLFSVGNGYPATNVTNSTSSTCTWTTTTSTNNSGPIPVPTYSCGSVDVPVQDIPIALVLNLITWVPLVGCFLFSMPVWSEGSPRYSGVARLLCGSVPAASLILNLVGIGLTGSLNSLPAVHSPLNPYPAIGECDSLTSLYGCVFVNQLSVFVDYAFWLGVVILASIGTSEFISHRANPSRPLRKGVLFSLGLVVVLVMGLMVIPASIAESGVLVSPGSSFSFNPYGSFVRMPFVVSHHETLKGAFISSAAVDVYLLNSSQYNVWYRDNGFCPVSPPQPLLAKVARGNMTTVVSSGSYNLIFCSASTSYKLPSVTMTITSAVKLSG